MLNININETRVFYYDFPAKYQQGGINLKFSYENNTSNKMYWDLLHN